MGLRPHTLPLAVPIRCRGVESVNLGFAVDLYRLSFAVDLYRLSFAVDLIRIDLTLR